MGLFQGSLDKRSKIMRRIIEGHLEFDWDEGVWKLDKKEISWVLKEFKNRWVRIIIRDGDDFPIE